MTTACADPQIPSPTEPVARSGRLEATVAAPVAERRDYSISYHGLTLDDPYHWLRDPDYPKLDDEDVVAYLEAENDYFDEVMKPHQALVESLFEELKARQAPDLESVPWREGEYFYQWRYPGVSEYRVWTRTPVDGGNEEIILDEPALAEGHEYFVLGGMDVSRDGRYMAWSVDTDGSERYELRITDLDTGALVGESIRNVSGDTAWSADGSTLLYTVLGETWRPFQVRAHRLGSSLSEDRVVFEEEDVDMWVTLGETRSGDFILIDVGGHQTTETWFLPAGNVLAEPVLIAERIPEIYYEVTHARDRFYIRIDDLHKNFRVVTAPTRTPGRDHWQELIAGSDEDYIRGIDAFADFLVIQQRTGGIDQIRILDFDGRAHDVAFPKTAHTVGLGYNEIFDTDFVRLNYESMVTPDTVFDYFVDTRELVTRKVQQIPTGYDATRYETLRLMAPARDGEQVPVTVVYRRDYPKDNSRPLYITGYGTYGDSYDPGFSTSRLSLLDRGFAVAIAHIRGGDELGRRWYLDSRGDKRPNTFNDFIDATRFLVEEGFGAPGRIAASGGSAGGTVMGAVLNQAPELWGAMAAHVPFVDVVHSMLDDEQPLTVLEWPEWGNPAESKTAFETQLAYSPYDQIEAKDYPPIFLTGGVNDPRVAYWEPAKFAARLRHTKTDTNVLLLKTNMGSGHFGKTGRLAAYQDVAEEYAFVLLAMDIPES
ncbi:MAG: S9 family peptidase [Gammaproteobacteria bacterium]|nr:MAG: S9 family peptidase [Gammaproteobacteria bacterium]